MIFEYISLVERSCSTLKEFGLPSKEWEIERLTLLINWWDFKNNGEQCHLQKGKIREWNSPGGEALPWSYSASAMVDSWDTIGLLGCRGNEHNGRHMFAKW